MTLGSVARVAMEYRQHLQMLNSFSKLTADLASDSKVAKLGSPNCDTLSSMDKLNLDKVSLFGANKYSSPTLSGQNMPGFPTGNSLLDMASLMLFGTHALPVRLKILLDRLVCNLEQEDLVNLLHAFGWTYEDYSRGYMIQDSMGSLLTKWMIISKEEEMYIIQLFLKFPETKTIAQNFVLNEPIFNQYSDNSAISSAVQFNKFKDYKDYELKKLVDCTNANLLPKNSPFSLNSLKSPVLEPNTQKNQFENHNKGNKVSNHCDSEDKPNRSQRPSPEEAEKAHSANKHTNKAQLSPPVNHRLSTSPKSEKIKSEKNATNSNQNSLGGAPVNSLSKLENLIPNFEYRKKEPKSEPSADHFLAANVSAAAGTTNALFPLASPLNFNLLNQAALLGDPSKYPNAADLCKLDLTNPAAAAAFSAAASAFGSKNLDFSSFNKAESACNSNANNNNCAPTSDAINLTQNSKHNSSSNHMDKKASKHLRKSSAPIKRRWDPTILSSLTTNPTTGKKRVQCNVCFKTFCDKGALKIHFSAVHLREMHKCTVDGCSMMFSSRRSRNRHSANPNPKLHTPNFRRKINPHDGRTANPYPLIPTQTSSLFGIAGVNGGLMNNFDTLNGSFSDHSPKGDYGLDYNSMSSRSSRGSQNDDLDDAYSDDLDDDNGDMDDDDICIDLSVKDDTHKSQRKRKNFNPIKFNSSHNNGNCADELENDLENSEQYQYLSTDGDDDDDDDDLSSDAESSSKQIKLSGDDIENDAPTSNKHAPEDNDADTDIDMDEADNAKANHKAPSPNNNHALDSGDEQEVTGEDSAH